jgi:hypothetical protein
VCDVNKKKRNLLPGAQVLQGERRGVHPQGSVPRAPAVPEPAGAVRSGGDLRVGVRRRGVGAGRGSGWPATRAARQDRSHGTHA